ncbi:nucleoside-diphosphate kinase [Candidatus Pacearchaeota archaeon]|nr:nucleoside-diphosphate kinase [Candidatus Pacearchaeota archaeon]
MNEQTLILIKPDGVMRGLIGRIISRFEETGLKIVGLKMVWADDKLAKSHYHLDEEWAKNVFAKTKSTHEKEGKPFKFKDHMEFGGLIQQWNMEFLREGPVIAAVIEGPAAVEIVRKMIGHTEPKQAAPGTIRGDFAMIESYAIANDKQRVLRNLAHASDSPETAQREIALWFKPNEVHSYKNAHDSLTE